MRVVLIAAVAQNGVIGKDGQLPWSIPEDLRRFKKLTLGSPILMGRQTFESIGRPLPGRENLVLTTQADWHREGVRRFESLESALRFVESFVPNENELRETLVFIIGGERLYADALPIADRLEITEIRERVEGDRYFPEFDREHFKEVSRTPGQQSPSQGLHYDFVTYERVTSLSAD